MKKFNLMLVALSACAMTGCGLFERHVCPPPEKSTECYPLCIKDKTDNRIFSEKNWNTFKSFKALPYVPVNMALIDDSARIITNLSIQITNEIVIPYVELDGQGLIRVYQEYLACVEDVMKKQDCSAQRASELVWADWMKQPGGKNMCVKLHRAVPFIQNLRAKQQFAKAILRNQRALTRLSVTFTRQLEIFKRQIKTLEGQIKAGAAGAQVLYNISRLGTALSFLSALNMQQSEQVRDMENYILSVQKFYED